MSVKLNIQNKIIVFPTSGQSPNWAPAVVEFAQAVEDALNVAVGTYDVGAQVVDVSAYNGVSNVDVDALNFPPAAVRSANIYYAISRSTSLEEGYETGNIQAIYNNSLGQWELSTDYTGSAGITFNITNIGQVQFSLSLFTGINHDGKLTVSAKALITD